MNSSCEVDDDSVDLVSICQALHWLEVERFYSEVRRVLVTGGVLAVVGYHMTRIAPSHPQSDQVCHHIDLLTRKLSYYL